MLWWNRCLPSIQEAFRLPLNVQESHQVLGTVYYWYRVGAPGLMLIDANSDGLIDASQDVSNEDWSTLGLGPATSYSNLYF